MSRHSNGSSGPSFKKKFVDLFRQISQPGGRGARDVAPSPRPDTFIHKYLQGKARCTQPEILSGRSCDDLPPVSIGPLHRRVYSAFTGPGGGLASVNRTSHALDIPDQDVDYIDTDDGLPDDQPNAYVTCQKPPPPPHPALRRSEREEVAGVLNWNRPSERAFGLSTTLYERHPLSRERAGNPIADSFAVVARYNSALLALADGVNWGEKACLAARCAIHGCMSHLNAALYAPSLAAPPRNTTDLFVALLRSFHAAHSLILQEEGQLTTLTAAIVAPISGCSRYVVCVCNVGDSLAYVYSQQHGVREITQGSHDIFSMRDMRDALGALGPVDGHNPELNNLTCSMTYVEQGDLVFLTSDGISDNFDPVVGKFVLPKKEPKEQKPGEVSAATAPAAGGEAKREKTESEKIQERQLERQKQPAGVQQPVINGKNKNKHSQRQQQLLQKYQQMQEQAQYQQQKKLTRTQRIRQQQMSSMRNGFKQVVSRSKSQPSVNTNSAAAAAAGQQQQQQLPEPGSRRAATIAGNNTSRNTGVVGGPGGGDGCLDLVPPVVEAHQRHELTLLRMEDLLRCGITSNQPVTTAQALCLEMVHFATKLTLAKRRVLEDPDLYPAPKTTAATTTSTPGGVSSGTDGPAAAEPATKTQLSRNEQRNRRKKVGEKLALVPGKLDHATVVAYCVGPFDDTEAPTAAQDRFVLPLDSKTHLNLRHHTRTKHQQSRPGSAVYPPASTVGNGLHPLLGVSATLNGGEEGAAPLASPDSARSIASHMEELKVLSMMPPLPECGSPPPGGTNTRVTLAREESVECLLDSVSAAGQGSPALRATRTDADNNKVACSRREVKSESYPEESSSSRTRRDSGGRRSVGKESLVKFNAQGARYREKRKTVKELKSASSNSSINSNNNKKKMEALDSSSSSSSLLNSNSTPDTRRGNRDDRKRQINTIQTSSSSDIRSSVNNNSSSNITQCVNTSSSTSSNNSRGSKVVLPASATASVDDVGIADGNDDVFEASPADGGSGGGSSSSNNNTASGGGRSHNDTDLRVPLLETNKLSLSLKASSNKENLSPNVTAKSAAASATPSFELPLKPVVETLL